MLPAPPSLTLRPCLFEVSELAPLPSVQVVPVIPALCKLAALALRLWVVDDDGPEKRWGGGHTWSFWSFWSAVASTRSIDELRNFADRAVLGVNRACSSYSSVVSMPGIA
jgi:hypothetical protein